MLIKIDDNAAIIIEL